MERLTFVVIDYIKVGLPISPVLTSVFVSDVASSVLLSFSSCCSVLLLLFCILSLFIATLIPDVTSYVSSDVSYVPLFFSRSSIINSYSLVMNPLIGLFVLALMSHVIPTFNVMVCSLAQQLINFTCQEVQNVSSSMLPE